MLKIFIPDMSCSHCKRTLETLLRGMNGVESCEVDLEFKTLILKGDVDWKRVEAAIRDAGYTPVRTEN